MKHFLLIYDVAGQELRSVREFEGPQEAADEYARVEGEHLGDERVQIVLVAADSIETVKATHGNFFGPSTVDDLIESALARR
jgi:hypothetical protein